MVGSVIFLLLYPTLLMITVLFPSLYPSFSSLIRSQTHQHIGHKVVNYFNCMPGVGLMVWVVSLGSEDPEFKSCSAVKLIPGGVDSACHPSEVGKMSTKLLTHPGLCPIAKETALAAPMLCTEFGPNGWMDGWMDGWTSTMPPTSSPTNSSIPHHVSSVDHN